LILYNFKEDFAWLRREDEKSYNNLLKLVKTSYQHCCKPGVVGTAKTLINSLYDRRIQHKELRTKHQIRKDELIRWHIANHQELAELIYRYQDKSAKHVGRIHNIAMKLKKANVELASYRNKTAVKNRTRFFCTHGKRNKISLNGMIGAQQGESICNVQQTPGRTDKKSTMTKIAMLTKRDSSLR
jgi:hypothetical protein